MKPYDRGGEGEAALTGDATLASPKATTGSVTLTASPTKPGNGRIGIVVVGAKVVARADVELVVREPQVWTLGPWSVERTSKRRAPWSVAKKMFEIPLPKARVVVLSGSADVRLAGVDHAKGTTVVRMVGDASVPGKRPFVLFAETPTGKRAVRADGVLNVKNVLHEVRLQDLVAKEGTQERVSDVVPIAGAEAKRVSGAVKPEVSQSGQGQSVVSLSDKSLDENWEVLVFNDDTVVHVKGRVFVREARRPPFAESLTVFIGHAPAQKECQLDVVENVQVRGVGVRLMSVDARRKVVTVEASPSAAGDTFDIVARDDRLVVRATAHLSVLQPARQLLERSGR
jgi:hypothetical protein